MLAAALGVACTQFGFSQSFHNVSVPNNASVDEISAGGDGVWALDTVGRAYSYSIGSSGFTQYTQTSTRFVRVVAGGGNAFTSTPDAVWTLDAAGGIYKLTNAVFTKVPGVLNQIAVGQGGRDSCHPYEVWGINSSSEVYRFDYCSGQFNQQPGSLAQIAVGGAGVWGLTSAGAIYQLNFSTHTLVQVPGVLTQVAVGPTKTWGINSTGQVYRFDPATQTFLPLGGQFLAKISAGGNGVWGISSKLQIWRLETSTQSFVQVPGVLVAISVGTGGGIWGINGGTQPCAFATP
jgi:hypothetical protein